MSAISATDRAYGVEIRGRAEVGGMVKRYEVVKLSWGKYELVLVLRTVQCNRAASA